jgi:hypothetical protein
LILNEGQSEYEKKLMSRQQEIVAKRMQKGDLGPIMPAAPADVGVPSYPKARNLNSMTHYAMRTAKQKSQITSYDNEPLGLGGIISQTRGLSQQDVIAGVNVPKFNVTPYNV